MGKLIKHWELTIELNSAGINSDVFSGKESVLRLKLSSKPKVKDGILRYTHTREGVDGYVEVGISLGLLSAYSILTVFED